MTKVVVVVNPASGDGRGAAFAERLQEFGHTPLVTQGPDDVTPRVDEAVAMGADVVAAAGGDGTCHQVIEALMRREGPRPAFGIIPLGTGNDLARNLNVPLDPDVAVNHLTRPGRTIDLVRMRVDGSDRICANLLNAGISGEVSGAITAELKERWGRLSYLRAVTEVMAELIPWRVHVEVDGETETFDAFNVAVANGPRAGGGVPVAPDADPTDELVDLVLVRAAPLGRLTTLLPAVLAGEEPESELFVSWRSVGGRFTSDPPLPYSLDGEPGEGTDFRFEVLAGALEVRGGETP